VRNTNIKIELRIMVATPPATKMPRDSRKVNRFMAIMNEITIDTRPTPITTSSSSTAPVREAPGIIMGVSRVTM